MVMVYHSLSGCHMGSHDHVPEMTEAMPVVFHDHWCEMQVTQTWTHTSPSSVQADSTPLGDSGVELPMGSLRCVSLMTLVTSLLWSLLWRGEGISAPVPRVQLQAHRYLCPFP